MKRNSKLKEEFRKVAQDFFNAVQEQIGELCLSCSNRENVRCSVRKNYFCRPKKSCTDYAKFPPVRIK